MEKHRVPILGKERAVVVVVAAVRRGQHLEKLEVEEGVSNARLEKVQASRESDEW